MKKKLSKKEIKKINLSQRKNFLQKVKDKNNDPSSNDGLIDWLKTVQSAN